MMRECLLISLAASCSAAELHLDLRTRVQAFKASSEWQEAHLQETWPAARTAVVICDMWDNHWCKGAAQRVNLLAPRMAKVVDSLRRRGVQIVHAPSEVMDFYRDTPQRKLAILAAKVDPPASLGITAPPLPIDDSKGGCDTPDQFYKAWTREHPAIPIAPEDLISDKGPEIYSFLRGKGIDRILIMGVHTNMCILNRSFAIKQMTNWGVRCVLVRDLTDAMYNPADRPHVPHDQGTELVIEHIEKYWCPTTLSKGL